MHLNGNSLAADLRCKDLAPGTELIETGKKKFSIIEIFYILVSKCAIIKYILYRN